ncbi:MAG TPA: endolytic transglycosylase MltG [Gaiellaceae bacterium]|nr:endolytic transglycosylase MltG [Gaiellaceae bacterium]
MRRRLVAGVIVIVVAVAAGVAFAATRGSSKPAAPPAATTTIVQLHQFEIIFPEGYTRLQMAAEVKTIAAKADREQHGRVRITEPAYLAASKHGVVPCFGKKAQPNLEGFLFPAGFDFDIKTTSRILVSNQLAAFCANWAKLDLAYARSKNLTPYDVLRIASMVEEEAAVPGDRPKIAAVIYNRLRDHMQLGIDATLRYGLHIRPTQSITQSELASDNPYNTRKLYGLPPTPIGNPGLASLEAAAHPTKLGYLYYVRVPNTNPGRHVFFESYSAYEQYLATHGYGPHP